MRSLLKIFVIIIAFSLTLVGCDGKQALSEDSESNVNVGDNNDDITDEPNDLKEPDDDDKPGGQPEEPDEPDEPKPEQHRINVMSFNVRTSSADDGANSWVNRRVAFPVMIADQKPDVMGVQEPRIDQIEWMNDNLTGYKSIGVGRNNASNSEYPSIYYLESAVKLERWGNFWLSTTPNVISRGWDAALERNLTWAEFTQISSQKRFFIMNTHLDHQGTTARNESMKLIVEKMKELNAENLPTLLIGDLNATLISNIFNNISAIMADARLSSPDTDNKDSFNEFGTRGLKIDHIFYSSAHFTPVQYRTIDRTYAGVPFISDHYPIKAILQFK